MRKKLFRSTFTKMTTFYIAFGVIPLVLVSMMFFYWYYKDVEKSTLHNYAQVAEYAQRNLSSLILKADDAAGYLYDFSVDEYGHLYEILKDEKLNPTQKSMYVNSMLQDMMMACEAVSSLRFYTNEGEDHTLFRVQGKSLRQEAGIMNEAAVCKDQYHKMMLMPAVEESEYCTNTKDVVFSVVRCYMDTSSVKSIAQKQMGTLYLDISVKEVEKILEAVQVGEQGKIHVLDPEKNQWIYSSDKKAYGDSKVAKELGEMGASTVSRRGKYWYFTQPIRNTEYMVVLQIFSEDVLDTYIKNRTYITIVLALVIVMLSAAYLSFSEKLNGPVRKLKDAMQQVQTGDLKVKVDIRTHDELEYLGEGFNKMVQDLAYYIEEVYVAKLRQKEAELDALKMQIQPHYLYNTLDVIRMTALEHKDQKTARLLESLARQLRYVMGQSRERVPLYMELDSIREYIVLMNARSPGKYQLNINVSDQDRELYVLKLLLQPMVENAVKHGLRDKEGVGTIEVNVKRGERFLEIVVMDDGKGMTEKEEQCLKDALKRKEISVYEGEGRIGIGFLNVRDRIQLSCGEECGVTFTSYENVGTMVKFLLPLWEGDSDVENGDRG